jgi:glutamine amidotransferase
MRVAIYDYGIGNIFSIKSALSRLGAESFLTRRKRELDSSDAIVLPGVGSYDTAMNLIEVDSLKEIANSGKIIVGICLGLQLMYERSEEGKKEGLSLLKGKVRKLQGKIKVPHMGWNNIKIIKETPVLYGIEHPSWVYYAHSYYPEVNDYTVATTHYGRDFSAVVQKSNIVGMQFHPEKSGKTGMGILANLLELAKR